MKTLLLLCLPLLIVASTACIHVTTESEIKPIHITMDVNLKVDKELEKSFGAQDRNPPQGAFKDVKTMLERGAAGVSNRALLVPRDSATDEDRVLIVEQNSRNMKRFSEIATESGASIETVQKMRAKRIAEFTPEGSGVWLQREDGAWYQK